MSIHKIQYLHQIDVFMTWFHEKKFKESSWEVEISIVIKIYKKCRFGTYNLKPHNPPNISIAVDIVFCELFLTPPQQWWYCYQLPWPCLRLPSFPASGVTWPKGKINKTKGQLISKGLSNSSKKQTKIFCPSRLGQKLKFSS